MSPVWLKYEPAVVEEFNGTVSVVDFNPVSGGICLVVTPMPGCVSFNVQGKIIGGSRSDWDKAVVFWDIKV